MNESGEIGNVIASESVNVNETGTGDHLVGIEIETGTEATATGIGGETERKKTIDGRVLLRLLLLDDLALRQLLRLNRLLLHHLEEVVLRATEQNRNPAPHAEQRKITCERRKKRKRP